MALAVGCLMSLAAGAASAATISPTVLGDAPNGSFDDTGCTLRDAVQAANTNTSEPVLGCIGDTAGADTILLQGGKTYVLSTHGVDDSNAKGDLDITGPLTIRSVGPGLATINAESNPSPPPAGADRAIDVRPSAGAVTLEGVRIISGLVDVGAGFAEGGGGIQNRAQLTVVNSEIAFNQVQGTSELFFGGGIYTRGTLGTLTMSGSTVANNTALALGVISDAAGGGIASWEKSPTLTITNSTISGNRAQVLSAEPVPGGGGRVGAVGGGIFAGPDGADNQALTTLTGVTVTNNQAISPSATHSADTGGLVIEEGKVSGLLVAGNTDQARKHPDCKSGLFADVESGGGNLVGDPGVATSELCSFSGPGDLSGTKAAPVNPNLGLLLDNGGPTRTHLPNPGSPAINRGGACPATDQRGFLRGPVAPCDSGAVEVGALPPAPPGQGGAGGGSQGSGSPPPRSAASVSVKGKAKTSGGRRGRVLVMTGIEAACSGGTDACSGTATIDPVPKGRRRGAKPPKSIGVAGLSVAAGQTTTVALRLNAKASNELRETGSLKVKISVSLSAPGGAAATSRTAVLKPPPKPKPKR
jgi:hypothetical protein